MTISKRERPDLTNRGEPKNFLRTVFTWRASVAPRILLRTLVAMLYGVAVHLIILEIPHIALPVAPFEYSGAVLGLLLVLRINSGHDRWWEGRKLWGQIVNQSRNLGIVGVAYGGAPAADRKRFLQWVAAWPHVMRASLRREHRHLDAERLLGPEEAQRVRDAQHGPTYVGLRIAQQLARFREGGADGFAFHRGESERSLLIDAIGACERIRNTPIPFAFAVKIRRFIALFVALLPFALAEQAGGYTSLIIGLTSYPLFAMDEIGAELQNPFSPRNLSHLPLTEICQNIEKDVLSLDESV